MTLSKVKYYFLGFFVLVFAILLVQTRIQSKIIKTRNATISRISENNYQLMSDLNQQTNLNLTQKEVTGKLKRERDSLASALKVKPKQVDKIVYIDNSTHDTVRVSVPTISAGKDYWYIQDSSKCFKWAANAYLWDSDLKVDRTLFEYDNRTTEVFYRKAPHIWFIRLGKWTNFVQINAKCGDVKTETFNFIK